MMPYMILKHLGHKNGIDLSSNAFYAGNKLLLFFVDVRHNLLEYPRGVWYKMKGESFHSRRRNRTPYEHKFRTRAS
jgi:hypothetical protein